MNIEERKLDVEISKEYLESLNCEELEKLYHKYYNMGYDVLRYDVGYGLTILDLADKIEVEVKRREELNNSKGKIKKIIKDIL